MSGNNLHQDLRGAAEGRRCRGELYVEADGQPAILAVFPVNLYSALMQQPNDPDQALSSEQMPARIQALQSDLELARSAAAAAETEQGRLQGELTKTTELWVAACHAREQWDILFSENVEELRLANEQLAAARRSRTEIEQSTSWRLIQTVLAPYRRLRGLR